MRRLVALLASSGLVTGLVLVATVAPALACDKIKEIKNDQGEVVSFVCLDDIPGGGSGGGDDGGSGGGGGEPTCDLSKGLYNEFCIGEAACFVNDPAAIQDTAENGLSEADKPNPDSYAVYWQCRRPDGSNFDRYYWNDDQPTVTVADRIRSAIGTLQLPTIQASFNPPGRTLVNLPTWWWAEGAPAGEIQGAPALGAVAYAVPRGLSVVPGDGSPAFTCPMAVTKSDACTYLYRRAGDYTASVAIVYDIRIEIGGTAIPTDQIPANVRTITVDDDVPVAVREIQTRVTKVR